MSDIEERVKQYIDSRLTSKDSGYLGYYDSTAKRMKRRYLQTRSAAAVGAVLIPVVSNLPWEPHIRGFTVHVATVGASLIGLAVALILALDGVFHFKEQWQNFRGTEQYLLSQKYRYENGVDEYKALSAEDAFKQFVSRVEKAILDENSVTLNILGHPEGASPGAAK
jgi:hypothetical protein